MYFVKTKEKCVENCLVRPRHMVGFKTERKKKPTRFIHTEICNPFYERTVPSIVDPFKISCPVKKHEKLGFLSSDIRFYTSARHTGPSPSDLPIFVSICQDFKPKCPNGFGSMQSMTERFPDLCKLPETPGPADYTVDPNAWKKHKSFNKVSSDIFPVMYGTEPDCFRGNPAPNHYNVSYLPFPHCCNWRTYRSVFARKYQTCFLAEHSIGPTQYDVKDTITKPSLIQPVVASFKSGVPILSSIVNLSKTADMPGPQTYDPKFIECWMTPVPKRAPRRLKKTFTRLPPANLPGPGSHEIGHKPILCRPVPTAAFAKPFLLQKQNLHISPGPADYFPKFKGRC